MHFVARFTIAGHFPDIVRHRATTLIDAEDRYPRVFLPLLCLSVKSVPVFASATPNVIAQFTPHMSEDQQTAPLAPVATTAAAPTGSPFVIETAKVPLADAARVLAEAMGASAEGARRSAAAEVSGGADEDGDDGPRTQREEPVSAEYRAFLASLTPEAEAIEANSMRIFSLDELPLATLSSCISLSVRKNIVHYLDKPLPSFLAAQLEELDLFDNKIKHIGGTKCAFFRPMPDGSNTFRVLRKLDLSYNRITKIHGLEALGATLEELYLVENRIKEIEGLDALTQLKLLELGGNQLRSVGSGLEKLVNLEQLWLGKNKIVELGTGFLTLTRLRRLSLQANRLTDESVGANVFPPGALPELTELYLSENNLTCVANVHHLPALVLLDYSFNPIKSLDTAVLSAAHFPHLEDFWLTDGKVDEWPEVEKFAQFAATLRTLYLERNPIENDKRYRDKVYRALPFLTQIDSWPVVNRDNLEADRAMHRRS